MMDGLRNFNTILEYELAVEIELNREYSKPFIEASEITMKEINAEFARIRNVARNIKKTAVNGTKKIDEVLPYLHPDEFEFVENLKIYFKAIHDLTEEIVD